MTHNLKRSGFAVLAAFATAVSMVVAGPAQAVIVTTQTVTVTVDAACSGSWSWKQETNTLSCVTAPTGTTPALANCRFGSPPGPATAGTGFPVTVVCDNGPPTNAATFTWYTKCSGCTATSTQTSTGSNTLTLPSQGTWTVWVEVAAAGNNGTGRTPDALLNVTGGPVVATESCGSEFANTRRVPVTWSSGVGNIHVDTAKFGHFGPNDAIVLEIATPAVLGGLSYGAFQFTDLSGSERIAGGRAVGQGLRFYAGTRASAPRAFMDGIRNGTVYFSTAANDYSLPGHVGPERQVLPEHQERPGRMQRGTLRSRYRVHCAEMIRKAL